MKAAKWVVLLVLSGFFLVSGLLKGIDPAEFSHAIERYRIVGGKASWYAALWLPWLECMAAVCLLIPGWRKAALVLVAGMLFFFEAVLASAYWRGLDISCGCLGGGPESSVGFAIVRNLVLLVLVGIVAFAKRKEPA